MWVSDQETRTQKLSEKERKEAYHCAYEAYKICVWQQFCIQTHPGVAHACANKSGKPLTDAICTYLTYICKRTAAQHREREVKRSIFRSPCAGCVCCVCPFGIIYYRKSWYWCSDFASIWKSVAIFAPARDANSWRNANSQFCRCRDTCHRVSLCAHRAHVLLYAWCWADRASSNFCVLSSRKIDSGVFFFHLILAPTTLWWNFKLLGERFYEESLLLWLICSAPHGVK